MTLIEAVTNYIIQHNLISTSEKTNRLWLVAVSGGVDSLALLHILKTLFPRLNIDLHVATLDHGLRGDVGMADVDFVQETAAAWSLPCTAGKVDVHALAAERKLSVETAARQARYNFLAKVARNVGANVVATGHHADDQAETVLMHMLRGSGTQGLIAMRPTSPLPGYADLMLLRPLLGVRRADLEGYCREENLSPRDDTTNHNTHYFRNLIRHELLPSLARVNPQIVTTFSRLAENSAIDDDFIGAEYRMQVEPYVDMHDDYIVINRAHFGKLHPALQRRFVKAGAEHLSRNIGETISYERILAAVHLASEGKVGARSLLPGNLQLRVDYDTVIIELQNARWEAGNWVLIGESDEIPLSVPGETPIPGANWSLCIVKSLPPDADYHKTLFVLPESRIVLRGRREGDRFSSPGLNGHSQSIKKWMINRKIPRKIRDRVPLLVIEEEIAAICTGETWILSDKQLARQRSETIYYFLVKNS